MKKIIIALSICTLLSCQNRKAAETSAADTATAEKVVTDDKDTTNKNTGAWFANVKPAASGKGGVLTVSGVITPVDPKAKPSLSKNTTSASEAELVLNLSSEPKPENEKRLSTVTYTEKVPDLNKYKKVIVFFNGKLTASIDNIEHMH